MPTAVEVPAGVPEFTLTRLFAAPRSAVYRVFTDPKYVGSWWGIEGCTNPVCEMDVRPGGAWRIDMRVPSGTIFRNEGVYLEVVPNERLVYTDVPFADSPAWGGRPPGPIVHTVTFAEEGGRTRVTLVARFQSVADRDRLVVNGITKGIGQGLDRLERLLETVGAVDSVVSRDGTRITYERFGAGPALILVGGAFNDRNARGAGTALARLLAPRFTVYAYDRRGRGASGDTPPYAPERELEDLEALISAAGGSSYAYGISSGAALVLRAAAAGLALSKLALYEPPFSTDEAAESRAKAYTAKLAAALREGRRADAVALFMGHVGLPDTMIAQMRGSPMWPGLEAMAPTLRYDSAVMRDADGGGVPSSLAAVNQPTLVVCGGNSPPFLIAAARAAHEALPDAQLRVLDGQTHDVAPEALAEALADFF